jgi:hypothetical protein
MQTLGSEGSSEAESKQCFHHFIGGGGEIYIEQTAKCESHEDCPLDPSTSSDDDNMTETHSLLLKARCILEPTAESGSSTRKTRFKFAWRRSISSGHTANSSLK